MSGNERKEFGDYQTPTEFCMRICEYLKKSGIECTPQAILEPTCGIGNFISAVAAAFDCSKIYGIEINEQYAEEARKMMPNANIILGDIFDFNTRQICQEENVLIIGNPPWATNSNQSYNLPQKTNFKGLPGIEALTGSSNFDICEYIILQLLHEYKNTDSTICMLCKTSVARNVILELSRNEVAYQKVEMHHFNSNKVFGVSAAACVLVIKLSSQIDGSNNVVCEVKNFDTNELISILTVSNGVIKNSNIKVDLEGKCQLIWRQGVKHDNGKVMELDLKGTEFINKHMEYVHIEDTLVFPLVKSSHFKKPIINEFSKYVIVTQSKPKQDTSYIQNELPFTWKYLTDHIDSFNNRKSIIYKNSPLFAMFGIGNYSFAPYKVGLSGFYKKPLFSLLYSNKPVMTDDTAYFLAFDNYDIAYCMMLLLNSTTVQEFLVSIAFLDNKRPYTVKLLSRLDFQKCVDEVSFEEIRETEDRLQLECYATAQLYGKFVKFINSKT